MRTAQKFKKFVSDIASYDMPGVFNPYRDSCPVHDGTNSVEGRRKNLETYLQAASEFKPDSVWVGRDLGYRGGRRTGIPLTDEAHLNDFSRAYCAPAVKKATLTDLVAERTSAEIWRIISRLDSPPFLWNAFPFHPFEPLDPMTNRCHTRSEFSECAPILDFILETFKFKRVFALGNDAARVLERYGVEVVYVRHPSYGGQADFRRVMEFEYGVRSESSQIELFN